MIPERLVVQGLYSFRERQEIDFTRLTEGRLFGIFGPVGSGKSSLLEAISYALFGETERLNRQEQRSYNMMNLRSNELLIEFIFRAGRQGQHRYRFLVQGKRHKKEFEKVGTLLRTAYEWVEEAWKPLETTDGEVITGLSYEHFRRVVIIPQGKFQEFLHLGDKDRAEMMKELFHLEKFDLDGKARLLDVANQRQLDNLEGQLSQVPDIAQEQLEQMRSKLALAEKSAADLSTKVRLLALQDEQWQRQRELQQKEAAAQQQVQRLRERLPEVAGQEAQAQLWLSLHREAAPLLERLASTRGQLADAEQAQQKSRTRAEVLRQETERHQRQAVIVREAYERRDELRIKAEHLQKVAQAKSKADDLQKLRDRSQKGQKLIEEMVLQVETGQRQLVTLKESIAQRQAESQLPRGWQELQKWYGMAAQLAAQEAQLRASETEAQTTLLKAEAALKAPLEEARQLWPASVQQAPQLGEWLDQQVKALQPQIQSLRAQLQQLGVTERLSLFANQLQEGDPCPLCGSVHHPHLFSEEESQAHKLAAEAELQQAETLLQKAGELKQVWLRLWEKRKEAELSAANVGQRLAAHLAQRDEHLAAFVWQGFSTDSPEQLQQLIGEAERAREEREKLEAQRLAEEKQLEESEKQREKYRFALEQFDREMIALQAEQTTLLLGNPEAENPDPGDALLASAESLLRRHADAGKAHEDAERVTRELAAQLASCELEVATHSATLAQLQRQAVQEENQLSSTLVRLGVEGIAQAEGILAQPLQAEEMLRQAEAHRLALQKAEVELQVLLGQRPAEPYPAEEHEALQAELAQTRAAESAAQQEIGALQAELAASAQALERRQSLLAQWDLAKQRREDIATLRSLFKGNGFVNHVSTGYLSGLAKEANVRFRRLTSNRLSLELDDTNNFVVRDHTSGGMVRNVKTLSGGQTFQAALCLALALSDLLSAEHGQHQNFFFLDEGFGTLDRESLGLVFQTLMELRRENRIVGVISHIEDLQQEIDTWLMLRLDDEKGTCVRGSWELP